MATGWTPIADADETTKDGHDVLVATTPGGRQQVARWDAARPPEGGWYVDDRQVFPTHVQELGEPPADEEPEPATKGKATAKASKD